MDRKKIKNGQNLLHLPLSGQLRFISLTLRIFRRVRKGASVVIYLLTVHLWIDTARGHKRLTLI
jgi:hypothetical protein